MRFPALCNAHDSRAPRHFVTGIWISRAFMLLMYRVVHLNSISFVGKKER